MTCTDYKYTRWTRVGMRVSNQSALHNNSPWKSLYRLFFTGLLPAIVKRIYQSICILCKQNVYTASSMIYELARHNVHELKSSPVPSYIQSRSAVKIIQSKKYSSQYLDYEVCIQIAKHSLFYSLSGLCSFYVSIRDTSN